MLDLTDIRARFADYLAHRAAGRKSLDAALMHVVEHAYRQGLTDALLVPDVLRDPIPDLDPTVAPGVRGALVAGQTVAIPAPLSGRAGGAGAGRDAEGGDAAPAPGGQGVRA